MNTLASRVDRDKLMMVSRDHVAATAHSLLDGGNHEKPAELVAGTAILFFVMSERSGIPPEELYHLGRKLVTDPANHHDKSNAQIESLRDFAGLRVRETPLI